VIAAAGLGLAGAWLAAGSTGLLAHFLRRGLTVVALIAVVVLAWPPGRKRPGWMVLWVVTGIAAIPLLASALVPLNVLAVALVLLAVAQAHPPRAKQVIQAVAEAVVVLTLYRMAYTWIPWVWMVADGVGGLLGSLAARISRQPLWVGATFAGLDFLLPLLYLAVAVPLRSSGATARRLGLRRAGMVVGAVLLCQLCYLIALSFAPAILEADWMQAPQVEAPPAGATPPAPGLVADLRLLIPWNMPALAGMLQLAVAGVLLWRTRRWPEPATDGPDAHAKVLDFAGMVVALVLAVLAPLLVTLFPRAPDLQGKKIVFYEKGFLNWLKPVHGQYGRLSIGMYGMLPTFLESFGARPLISPELSAIDLEGADAVVLLFPNQPWQEGQLERLWKFVDRGGTLLVVGEHTTWERDAGGQLIDADSGRELNRFNEVLAPTAMRVNFDSAMFAVGGWLHSYEALAHPTTAGIRDEQNEFGVVIGASLDVRWPARPVLIGRWGWADPGDPESARAMMGDDKYTAGDKLGDVILAAEQPFGKGKIVSFGDTSSFTNGLTVGCHDYTSRLFAYLADRSSGVLPGWRLLTALAVLMGLAVLVVLRPRPLILAAASLGLAVSLPTCTAISYRAWQSLPDGRYLPNGEPRVPNNLAYIDTSHLGSYSPESLRPEGLLGLTLTLMRNGYLTLHLSELTPERLERARLLVSVAPAQPFSRRERELIEAFVRKGGIFISTVGYEERVPSQELLAELGFHIGQPPQEELLGREPKPLGHFKSPFFNGGSYLAYVRFHAAWRVVSDDPHRLTISFCPPDHEVIVMRRVGLGLVVVVGDTYFATNKNLENEGGEPFEGRRENAVFWRWLLALMRDGMNEGKPWYPPADECTPVAPAPTPGASPAPSGTPSDAGPMSEDSPSPEDSPMSEDSLSWDDSSSSADRRAAESPPASSAP
jgi:hypothetical protein